MSLTTREKADVILSLGWSAKTIIEGSTDYSKIIADRLNSLTDAFEFHIRNLLVRISALDTKLDEASSRLSAKQVGDITLRDDEIQQLKLERKRNIKRLASLVDIPARGLSGDSISVIV